jgi:hypothetical protein
MGFVPSYRVSLFNYVGGILMIVAWLLGVSGAFGLHWGAGWIALAIGLRSLSLGVFVAGRVQIAQEHYNWEALQARLNPTNGYTAHDTAYAHGMRLPNPQNDFTGPDPSDPRRV